MKVQSRGPPSHARHHPFRHRSPRRSRRRVARARAAARRRSSRTTSPGTSRSRRRTPRRGSSKGTIQALRAPRLHRPGLRPEQDRRHQRVQGRGPQPLRADLQALRHPRPLQLQGRGHDVGALRAEGADARARTASSRRASTIPDYFFGKNIVHLPTTKCHIYTTTTGAMKNAFGGLLNTRRHYTHSWIHETLVDLLAIQKEIHSGPVRDHGRHDRRQRPGAAHDVSGGQERDARVGRPGGDRRGRRRR